MLGDISKVKKIYIACGYTDMRKSIDGLIAIVQQNFKHSPFENSLFLFCGTRRDRINAHTGKETVSFCFTSGLREESFSDLGLKEMCAPSISSSFNGYSKANPLISRDLLKSWI